MASAFREIFRNAESDVHFDAFISYSHQEDNKAFAVWLQRELEKYAKPWYRIRALRIFRDETNFGAEPKLWANIVYGLSRADWLIFLASPESATSEWVAKELKWWIENNGTDHILIVQTGGELCPQDFAENSKVPGESTAIPEVLKGAFEEEPLVLNASSIRAVEKQQYKTPELTELAITLAATIKGIPVDTVKGEAARQQRNTRIITRGVIAGLSILLAVAVLFGVLASINLRTAQSRRVSAQAILLANANPRLAAAYALTGKLLEDSEEARQAELFVAQNNRYVKATAAITSTRIQSIACSGDTVLVYAGNRVVSVLSYPSLDMRGSFETETGNVRLSGYPGNKFVIMDGGNLRLCRMGQDASPVVERAYALRFSSQAVSGPYVDSAGNVLVMANNMEGVYWLPSSNRSYSFDFRAMYGDKSIVAASGFGHHPGMQGAENHTMLTNDPFFFATKDGSVYRLHLGQKDSDREAAYAWMEYAFQNQRGSRVSALGWSGDSLLVGTDIGLSLWDNIVEAAPIEHSFPYGGVLATVLGFAAIGQNTAMAAVLTSDGLTVISDDNAQMLNGVSLTSSGNAPYTAIEPAGGQTWIAGRSNGTIILLDPGQKPLSSGECITNASAHDIATDGTILLSTGQQQYADGVSRYTIEEDNGTYALIPFESYGIGVSAIGKGIFLNKVAGDGQAVAACGKRWPRSAGGIVLFWDKPSPEPALILDFSADSSGTMGYDMASSVAYAPELRRIAAFNLLQGAVAIWSAETGERLHTIQLRAQAALAENPSGDAPSGSSYMTASSAGNILAAAADGMVTIIDVSTGKTISQFERPERPIISPDGRHVAFVSGRDVVVITDLEGKEEGKFISPHFKVDLAWSPDSKFVAIAMENAELTLVGTTDFRQIGLPIRNPSGYLPGTLLWCDGGSKLLVSNGKWIADNNGGGHYEMQGIDIIEPYENTFEKQLFSILGDGIIKEEWRDADSWGIRLPKQLRYPDA